MTIRVATGADHEAIARVVGDAFGGAVEVELVARIRASREYVPALELVALDEAGDVVGHVMFSYSRLEREHADVEVLQLSPLSVAPGRQREGIGAALSRAGLDAADARGEPLVLVLGHPRYYPRFGFERASDHGLDLDIGRDPGDAFMVRKLAAYRPDLRGRVVFGPAFADL